MERRHGAFGVIESQPTPAFSWLTVDEARNMWHDRFSSGFTDGVTDAGEPAATRFRALVCDSPKGPLTLFEPAID